MQPREMEYPAGRDVTTCFTGHRTYDGGCNYRLRAAIEELYAQGYRTFLSGMAVGFDIAAAEMVLALRIDLPDLRLGCLVPFEGVERSFSREERRRFEAILRRADEVVVLAERYSHGVYYRRNDALVERSSAIVAYFDGSKGGTAYTLRRAAKERLQIRNIYQNPQQELIL